MAKKNRIDDEPPLLKIMSGATGGPSTGHGIEYQVEYAIFRALNLISQTLANPLNNPSIIMEARAISGSQVTRWDIGIQPNDEHIEAKVNLTRDDTQEWIENISKAAESSPSKQFKLAYGEGNNALLKSIKALIRIGNECELSPPKFQSLVDGEQVSDADSIITLLGTNAHSILCRLFIELNPEESLKQQVQTIATTLAGADGGRRLYRILHDDFSHGISGRKEFRIKDLIVKAQYEGIRFNYQPEITSSNYEPIIQDTLYLLQFCSNALPISVIAIAAGRSQKDLETAANKLLEEGIIIEERDGWRIEELPDEITHNQASALLTRALRSLLEFINQHKNADEAYRQVDNAIFLAEEIMNLEDDFLDGYRVVVNLFPTIDKLLKRLGDFETVLKIAELSFDAGKQIVGRNDDETDAIARCLICGIAWAYQRMRKLDKAEAAYNEARQIAEGIDAYRSLAFIDKCVGRLRRLQAEKYPIGTPERTSKLLESVQLLENSIEKFENLQDFSAKYHEIGDAYSLLGRTYLVANNLQKAEKMLLKAYPLIDDNTKEKADLLILHGDLEVHKRNFVDPESFYSQAINITSKVGNDWSEIRARALRQRGFYYKSLNRTSKAKTDFQNAQNTYSQINWRHDVAEMEWQIIMLENKLWDKSVQRLEKESAPVRMLAVQKYFASIEARKQTKVHVSSRAEEPGIDYWDRLIREAIKEITRENLND